MLARIVNFLLQAIFVGVEYSLAVVLSCVSVMPNDVKHPFCAYWPFGYPPLCDHMGDHLTAF